MFHLSHTYENLYSREYPVNYKSIKFVFASLPWQQYKCRYQRFEEIEGYISAMSLVTTFLISVPFVKIGPTL